MPLKAKAEVPPRQALRGLKQATDLGKKIEGLGEFFDLDNEVDDLLAMAAIGRGDFTSRFGEYVRQF